MKQNRGEIATFLTLLTVGVILLGTILGANQTIQKTALTLFGRASEPTTLDCDGGACKIRDFTLSPARSRPAGQYVFAGNLCFTNSPPANSKYVVEVKGAGGTVVGNASGTIQTPSTTTCDSAPGDRSKSTKPRGIAFSSITASSEGLCSTISISAGYEHRMGNQMYAVTLPENLRNSICVTPVPTAIPATPVATAGPTRPVFPVTTGTVRPTLPPGVTPTVNPLCGKPCGGNTSFDSECGELTCSNSCIVKSGSSCTDQQSQSKVCRNPSCLDSTNCLCAPANPVVRPTAVVPTNATSCTFSATAQVVDFATNLPIKEAGFSVYNDKQTPATANTMSGGVFSVINALLNQTTPYKPGDIASIHLVLSPDAQQRWQLPTVADSFCSDTGPKSACATGIASTQGMIPLALNCNSKVTYGWGLKKKAGAPTAQPTAQPTTRLTATPTQAATGFIEVRLVTAKKASDVTACTREVADRIGTSYTKTDDITTMALRGQGSISNKTYTMFNFGSGYFSQHNLTVGDYAITINTTPKGYDIADSCKNKIWTVRGTTNLNERTPAALILVPRVGPEPTIVTADIDGIVSVEGDKSVWDYHSITVKDDTQLPGHEKVGGAQVPNSLGSYQYHIGGLLANKTYRIDVRSILKNSSQEIISEPRIIQLPLSQSLNFTVRNPNPTSQQSGQDGFAGVVKIKNASDPTIIDGINRVVEIYVYNSGLILSRVSFDQFPYSFRYNKSIENEKKYQLFAAIYDLKSDRFLNYSPYIYYTAPNDKVELVIDMSTINPFAMDVENGNASDISAITITRCNKAGFCENSRQVISIKSGDKTVVIPDKGTIKDDQIASVTCTIEYADGTKSSCPTQKVDQAKPATISVKTQAQKIVLEQKSVPIPTPEPKPDQTKEEKDQITASDINLDGVVNGIDYSLFIKAVQADSTDNKYDINGDGELNAIDMSILIDTLGEKVSP